MNYSWKTLAFDSELFGYKVVKIESIDSSDAIIPLIRDLQQNNVQYASFRIKSSEADLIEYLQKNGFRLVDALIALALDLGPYERLEHSPHVRRANTTDQKQLYVIASESFTTNRFYQDSFFKNKSSEVQDLYGKWIENSVKGEAADQVFVYEQDKRILGFVTLQNDGHIPLVAVRKDARGKGIAKELIHHALSYLKDTNVSVVNIETVIMNTPALRSYIGIGFQITSSYFTFAWHNDDTHVLH